VSAALCGGAARIPDEALAIIGGFGQSSLVLLAM